MNLINCSKCPRCNRLLNDASNRLVTDTCGHQKCRQCFLTDETDCLDCKEMSETALILENQIIVPSDTSNSFPNHIKRTTLQNGEDKYFCSVCSKHFSSRTQQYYHFACGNEAAKRFSCTFINCNKRFMTRSHLNYHLQAHTPGTYKCTDCGKIFKHQKVLQKHQRAHQVATVSCEKCGKQFRSAASLVTHMALHADEELPYKCKLCASSYLTKSALMQHAQKHEQRQRHQCPVCRKFYQRNSILQVHMKRHKKEQIYECDVCHKTFCDKDAVLRHKKQHMESSSLSRYRCVHCEITTIRKDNMQRHLRNMHGPDTDFASCVEIIAATATTDGNSENTPTTQMPQTIENSSVIKCIGNVKPIIIVPNSRSNAADNAFSEIIEPETALKPCKKAKYNPINLYRKILDLPGETESREADTDVDQAETAAMEPIVEEAAQTTPEMHLHWPDVKKMLHDEQQEQVLRSVYYLTQNDTKDWRKILDLGTTLQINTKRKLLWMWPTIENLALFKDTLEQLGITCLLSIGCGNGLLEWLIKEGTGTAVYGLEIDRNWWRSKYAVKSFIKLNYIEDAADNLDADYLRTCASAKDWNFALLFCYFNNRNAFLDYLRMYKGKWIVIMGPYFSIGTHTDPEPLEPKFPIDDRWQLRTRFDWAERNVVAIYEKLI